MKFPHKIERVDSLIRVPNIMLIFLKQDAQHRARTEPPSLSGLFGQGDCGRTGAGRGGG